MLFVITSLSPESGGVNYISRKALERIFARASKSIDVFKYKFEKKDRVSGDCRMIITLRLSLCTLLSNYSTDIQMSHVDFAQGNPFKKKAGERKSNEKEYFPLRFFQRIVLLSRIVFDPREILN